MSQTNNTPTLAKKVVIYTTPTCGFCRAAKEFFKNNNIQYEEKDVSVDQATANEMVQKSGQMGVPVILVGEEKVVGFDQPKLKILLGLDG